MRLFASLAHRTPFLHDLARELLQFLAAVVMMLSMSDGPGGRSGMADSRPARTAPPASASRLRIGYLNTRYPGLSHTFIEREIQAVRARGIEVEPFSIRPPGPLDTLGSANIQAARETRNILSGVGSLLGAQFWALFTRPLQYVRTFFAAQRLSPPGLKQRLLHVSYWGESAKLGRLMKRSGLRHMHVHMANNGATVALLANCLDPNLEYSLSIHGSLEFVNVDAFRLREKVRSARFVRCISNYCRGQLMAWTDLDDWARMHVVHTGLDLGQFPPRPPRQAGPLRLITVGRFDPIKGYPILLDACRQLSERGVDWSLEMIGDGEILGQMRNHVTRLGLEDRVKLIGAVGQDEIQAHFERADVMVVSSFMEGLPVVLMEAMAKEVTVVSTNIAGIPELIEHEADGLLVDPGCACALAGALERLARDPALMKRLGEAGRWKVNASFSIDHVGREMAELFTRYTAPH